MTLTHWFLLFGGLTIIAIAIDGIRRMVSRPSTLAIKLDATLQNLADDDYRSELPNGGARIVVPDVDEQPRPQPATAEIIASVEAADLLASASEPAMLEAMEQDADVPLVAAQNHLEENQLEESQLEDNLATDTQVVIESIVVVESAETIATETEEELVAETELVAEAMGPEFDLAAPEDDMAETGPVEENPLVAVFDPTRPVHEVVESHKMVQSDMFADIATQDETAETLQDWQAYTDLQEATTLQPAPVSEQQEFAPAEPMSTTAVDKSEAEAADEVSTQTQSENTEPALQTMATTTESPPEQPLEQTAEALADDILLTDTGLDEEPDTPADSLGARLAKVTSFSFGKMLLENRRKQAEEDKAIDEQTQVEGSVVANVEQILTIIVVAKDTQGFFGGHLQGLVEACGMVHGSMDLFHRHEDGLTAGQTQFSMANMTQSGAFDLATMSSVHTAGVVFFMTLPSANDRIRAFDYMLETAQCLANNLGGELYDEKRSVLRAQTVEHYRQRIREFERQRLARRAQGAS